MDRLRNKCAMNPPANCYLFLNIQLCPTSIPSNGHDPLVLTLTKVYKMVYSPCSDREVPSRNPRSVSHEAGTG